MLLGYDGSRWIERPMKFGMLPARHNHCLSFWQLDDAVAFLDTTGCHVLQGDNWIYQKLQAKPDNTFRPQAWLDPDSKGLIVRYYSELNRQKSQLWHYRDGKWKEVHGTGLKSGDSFYWVTDRTSPSFENAYANAAKPLRPQRKSPRSNWTALRSCSIRRSPWSLGALRHLGIRTW